VPDPATRPTLYERLGGVYGIAPVVDDFIGRVMADPRLNANPAVDEAHHRVPPAGFKDLVTEMVCYAADKLIADGDRAVMLGRCAWRYRKTGTTAESLTAHTWRFRAGLAVEVIEFYDTAAALAATRPD
jgi:hypothetical protein